MIIIIKIDNRLQKPGQNKKGDFDDTDLIEVACCLDMIGKDGGFRIGIFSDSGERLYPAPGIKSIIPDPVRL